VIRPTASDSETATGLPTEEFAGHVEAEKWLVQLLDRPNPSKKMFVFCNLPDTQNPLWVTPS
jgi:hypothetical protein